MPFNFGHRGTANVHGGTFNDVAGDQNNTTNKNSHNVKDSYNTKTESHQAVMGTGNRVGSDTNKNNKNTGR
ncbi:hypothetical protein E1B28_008421 [Marasmius oreades]|uniref:Uncharacterized protein n=1 Tax=Marasmius oreades TaxID=181124 RepID=A0A9P7RYI1_9AGAR|nr:uncharacterized protein E1B28_008421 [Marasmius oreades]KAG7092040.1 hypothetical protein E1B28_008421 [Marasmius oreades]